MDLSNKLNATTHWCTKPLAIQMKTKVDQMLDGNKDTINTPIVGNFGDAGAANMNNYQHLANAVGSVQGGRLP